ncbi:MAG: ABC transporter permease, partial [Thermoplasmata archaeon]|nr:ABC transporter permease [Thermoplasmata archaeon]
IRNFWIITITAIFVLLTLIESYFGSVFSTGWHDFGATISFMMLSVEWIVPILAFMLGYAAIIGEIERGSMSALLSMPINRAEIVFGKFLGLGGVLSLSILLGFGSAGAIIGIMIPNANYGEYLSFILSTVLYGIVYLSVAMFFSTLFKKRSTALGGAIFLWFFFNMILPLVLFGIAVAGKALPDIINGNVPDWYYVLQLINPTSVYSALVSLNVGLDLMGTVEKYPVFYTTELLVTVLIIWIIVFLILTFWRFRRKDI